jgi:hypothetical protein
MHDYSEFLDAKTHSESSCGFQPIEIPDCLHDTQRALANWSIWRGRAAIFADCGLGKSLIELVWANNINRYAGKPVLVACPLAVAGQMVREAEKFGIEAKRSFRGEIGSGIVVTNYDRLHLFSPNDFCGFVGDESGILKNFEGSTKQAVTDFMRKMKYRLLATATPSPNDYIELGTHSEALGGLGYMDMLGMFFKNDQNSLHPSQRGRGNDAWYGCKWRFKSHAERHFWRWMCSWSRAVRRPSDLGFDDGPFVLPELIVNQHTVQSNRPMDGFLFPVAAVGLKEQKQERKHTIRERCEKVAELVQDSESALCWCHLNPEGDLLTKIIDGAVQVSGRDSDEEKEEKFLAFERGEIRVLVTKPQIAGFGLNWQHCNHMTFFPSHSFEQYYQGVRRCWRFGQTKPVKVDIVTSEGECNVMANLQRKADAAERMFENLVKEMNAELKIERKNIFISRMESPLWW